jgi:PAS domain-containing protein
MNENPRLAEFLRHVPAAAAVPETAGRVLADRLLRLTDARLVVLALTDEVNPAPVVAPESQRILLQHPSIAVLLREAGEIETSRFYFSDAVVPGLAAVQSTDRHTNCLAVPLVYGDVRIGTLLLFGLASGKVLDAATRNAEMLVPLLAMALHNAVLQRQTKSKPSELILRESNARFQELVHCLPIPVALYDAQGDFLLINDRMTAIYGYSLENVQHLSQYSEGLSQPRSLRASTGPLVGRIGGSCASWQLRCCSGRVPGYRQGWHGAGDGGFRHPHRRSGTRRV